MKTIYSQAWNLLLVSLVFLTLAACSSNTSEKENNTVSPQKTSPSPTKAAKPSPTKKKTIVFFGNSLSAAYGLSNPDQGFVSLIEQRIDSLNLNYKVVNAGNSGETTAGGKGRINWILEQSIDVFVLELGGNDGLRGIDPKSSYENLEFIIQQVQKKYPEATIILAGMEAPPNMGAQFTSAFRAMYPSLAKKYNTKLIPFLLDKVGGIPSLNQADGIHPNAAGNQIIVENIWPILLPVISE